MFPSVGNLKFCFLIGLLAISGVQGKLSNREMRKTRELKGRVGRFLLNSN